MQANKLEDEGTAVQNLVKAHPAGKSFFKEQNGAVSLSSDPQTTGGCPLKFPGMSPLFWDRVRSVNPKYFCSCHWLVKTKANGSRHMNATCVYIYTCLYVKTPLFCHCKLISSFDLFLRENVMLEEPAKTLQTVLDACFSKQCSTWSKVWK